MNTEKNYPSSPYRKFDRMVARLKEILQCIICLEIVGCPALQCEAGHLMCGQCRDKLEENTCPTCRQPLIAVRNRAVEQVVEALPKECPYADHGCQELLNADEVDTHKVTCPFRQFSCPQPPCPWVGYKPEILGHMLNTHPQHVLSSNRQTVNVPVKLDEVSSWLMFLNDEVLVFKFALDRATNFLLGSFECLGQLNPVDSIICHMTVKKGDRALTLSGNVGPERSDAERQCAEEWDNVFPRSRYDVCLESESYINVDVVVEDSCRIAVAEASVDVEVQTQVSDDDDDSDEVPFRVSDDDDDEVWTQARDDDNEVQTLISIDVEAQTQDGDDDDSGEVLTQARGDDEVWTQARDGGVGDEAGGDTTRQVGGGNQSDQTADRVIHKLGSWLVSRFYDINIYTSSMSNIHRIITETKTNVISSLIKSIDDIDKEMRSGIFRNYLSVERYLYHLSRDLSETNIKMEHVKAAGGRHFSRCWLLPYLLIVEQQVHRAFFKYVEDLPAIDDVELERLLTDRDRRMCDGIALRILRGAYGLNGTQGVNNIIWHMGAVYKKSEEEICSIQSDAAAISWR